VQPCRFTDAHTGTGKQSKEHTILTFRCVDDLLQLFVCEVWLLWFLRFAQIQLPRCPYLLAKYINKARPYFLRDRISPYLFLGYHRKRAANANGPMIRQQLFNITTGWSMRVLGVASSPHKWRAACFTECAEKEMDVFDLMNLAGHSSPEVTPGYIRHLTGTSETSLSGDASPGAEDGKP
jgi:integrase